jgi:methylmalonyl-CoA/ethylmalonyl-CoA epimerase
METNGFSFHHIGVATRDLDAVERTYGPFGYRRERPDFFDPVQGVHGRFIVGGGPRLELLQNDSEPGALTPYLKRGTSYYHLGYEVDDLERARGLLAAAGAKHLTGPLPAVAFGGRTVYFYVLPNASLIELIGPS